MQIISLNILGGEIYEPLLEFLKQSVPTTDFFCFQEVYDSPDGQLIADGARANILSDLTQTLPDFQLYYAPVQDDFHLPENPSRVSYGLAIFAKKNIRIHSTGEVYIFRTKNSMVGNDDQTTPMNLQYLRFTHRGQLYTLAHAHGIYFPGIKLDTPQRLVQSQKIVEFLNQETGPKIFTGDLNLMPQTESIELIEQAGMKNLIKEFHITSTRSALNYAKYPANDRQYFADYMFVSPDIKVVDFQVPTISISDHLPLMLQFE